MAGRKLGGTPSLLVRYGGRKRGHACALAFALTLLGAANANAATVTFEPAFGEGALGEASTFTAAFTFAGTEYRGYVAPVTGLTVHLPQGVGGSTAGFATCPTSTLEQSRPEACPRESYDGPRGSFAAVLMLGGSQVQEKGILQPYFVPNGIDFFMEGQEPVVIEAVLEGTYGQDSSPYGRVLNVSIPLIETLPGAPASITGITLTLGATLEHAGAEYSSIVIPSTCPTGTFEWKGRSHLLPSSLAGSVRENRVPDASRPDRHGYVSQRAIHCRPRRTRHLHRRSHRTGSRTCHARRGGRLHRRRSTNPRLCRSHAHPGRRLRDGGVHRHLRRWPRGSPQHCGALRWRHIPPRLHLSDPDSDSRRGRGDERNESRDCEPGHIACTALLSASAGEHRKPSRRWSLQAVDNCAKARPSAQSMPEAQGESEAQEVRGARQKALPLQAHT
jgi:hypothetical protein